MPLYEYKCRNCKSNSEFMQKAGDPHKKKCPKCGGPLDKVLTAPALQFKGKGWYVTDYPKKSGGGEDSTKTSSESKSDSHPESKTAAPSAKKDKDAASSKKE
ncbi:MAG TPA: FmdB family zinc ribbon protein [Acidobacteriota bacterium]